MTLKTSKFVRGLRATLQHPALAAILAGVCYAIAGYVTLKMPSVAGFKLRAYTGLCVGLYLLASLLVTRLVLLLAIAYLPPRSAPELDLPLGRRGALRGRAAWGVPVLLFAIFTLLREGAVSFAQFDFWLSRDTWNTNWNSNSNYNFSTSNAARRRLGDLALVCTRLYDAGRSDIARGFDNFVHCPANASGPDTVQVRFQLEAPDAFCHLPLYRTADVRFEVTMSVSAQWNEAAGSGSGGGTVHVTGTTSVSSFGFMSCRRFNQMIGERIGGISVDAINAYLRSN